MTPKSFSSINLPVWCWALPGFRNCNSLTDTPISAIASIVLADVTPVIRDLIDQLTTSLLNRSRTTAR